MRSGILAGLFAVIAIVAGIVTWACGIGFAVSIIALVLKICGVGFLSTMSGWLPVQLILGWIGGLVVTAFSAALATTLAIH